MIPFDLPQLVAVQATPGNGIGVDRLQLFFLLLLRLSPPTHRLNPLSLHLPHSAVQTPVPFHFSSDEPYDSAGPSHHEADMSPTRTRWKEHARATSQHTILSTRSTHPDLDCSEDDEDENESQLNELEEEEDSDASSISESSIIDLPPPQTLARIIPPTSLSINTNLNLSLTEDSPVLGPLVRRTKSARLLAQSWGRNSPGKNRASSAYGTFGFGSGSRTEQTGGEG